MSKRQHGDLESSLSQRHGGLLPSEHQHPSNNNNNNTTTTPSSSNDSSGLLPINDLLSAADDQHQSIPHAKRQRPFIATVVGLAYVVFSLPVKSPL